MKRSSTLCSPSVIRVLLMLCTVFTPFLASAQWAAPKMPDQINSVGGVTPKSSLYAAAFTENAGQITDTEGRPLPDVRYLLNAGGMKVQLRSNGFSYDTWVAEYKDAAPRNPGRVRPDDRRQKSPQKELSQIRYHRIDVSFRGGNPNPVIEALEPTDDVLAIINEAGEMNIRQYNKVVYREIYPGIDLEFIVGVVKPKSGCRQRPIWPISGHRSQGSSHPIVRLPFASQR
jgi:hypothetical protein